MNITIKYSKTERDLVFYSRLWILLSLLVSHPSRHYCSYFFCLLYICMYAGAQPALHFGGGTIFMKFHSMTSSSLSNRGTTFSQTVTNIIMHFCPPESIVYKHTFCTTLVNKNRTFYNSVVGQITSDKRNF